MMKRSLAFLALSVATLSLHAQAPAEIPPRPQAPNDEAEYRRFTLDNGLKVILLSDPKLNTSSASLAVVSVGLRQLENFVVVELLLEVFAVGEEVE